MQFRARHLYFLLREDLKSKNLPRINEKLSKSLFSKIKQRKEFFGIANPGLILIKLSIRSSVIDAVLLGKPSVYVHRLCIRMQPEIEVLNFRLHRLKHLK